MRFICQRNRVLADGRQSTVDRGLMDTVDYGPRKAFTLIELLVVTVIVSVISLAIYTTLSSGLKIWKRASVSLPQEELYIFFDKFSLDVRNSFKYANAKFAGSEEKFEFPSFVEMPLVKARTIGRVVYAYDSGDGILTRVLQDYSDVYTSGDGYVQQAIDNIRSFRFLYYAYIKEKNEYVWQERWEKEEPPLAIRMEIEFKDEQDTPQVRTVSFPVAVP